MADGKIPRSYQHGQQIFSGLRKLIFDAQRLFSKVDPFDKSVFFHFTLSADAVDECVDNNVEPLRVIESTR